MSALEGSRRRPRAAWTDTRLLLGLVLVIASIAGVWTVVAAARQTVPVLAAARTIVPGEAISRDDVRLVDVALGASDDAYLSPDGLGAGAVADRTIGAGELLPRSAVVAAGGTTLTRVVVRSSVAVPATVATGAAVEVWSAPRLERGRYDAPRILVADATVVSVSHEDSVMGDSAATLELVIPRSDVAATLEAVSGEAALSVVPARAAR